jgi:DNA gyrase subunit B
MYVGDIRDGSGLAQLVWEVVANSIDENLAGHCTHIEVSLRTDGAVGVRDNGRGIRFDDSDGLPFAQRALTELHSTATMDGHAPHEHVALRGGIGLVAVNALSDWLEVSSRRNDSPLSQRYERGLLVANSVVSPITDRGTQIVFHPDPAIFGGGWINPGPIVARLREMAFLRPGLRLSFSDLRNHSFLEPDGIHALVLSKTDPAQEQLPVFKLSATIDKVMVDVAAAWTDGPQSIESFVNVLSTADGTHVAGFVAGLTKGLRRQLRTKRTLSRCHFAVCKGLVGVVCVRLDDPTYNSPTKSILSTPRVTRIVREAVAAGFSEWLHGHPGLVEHLERLATVGPPGY